MKADDNTIWDILGRRLSLAGFFTAACLSRTSLLETIEKCEISEALRKKYDLDSAASAVVVGLRYSEGDFSMPSWANGDNNDPQLGIGRFARANWYKELAMRLKRAVEETCAEAASSGMVLPSPKKWHRLVNSGLPEKAFAVKSGAGRIGKNQIVIARASRPGSEVQYSSAVVLGVLLCPVDIGGNELDSVADLCGNCSKCISACPTGALGALDHPAYSRLDCLQHWTSTQGVLPRKVETAFGARLYGCDVCLEACPHFHLDPSASTQFGPLGRSLPARYLLEASDAQLKADFAGTALDREWMSKEAFRRNARLVLGAKDEN